MAGCICYPPELGSRGPEGVCCHASRELLLGYPVAKCEVRASYAFCGTI